MRDVRGLDAVDLVGAACGEHVKPTTAGSSEASERRVTEGSGQCRASLVVLYDRTT